MQLFMYYIDPARNYLKPDILTSIENLTLDIYAEV